MGIPPEDDEVWARLMNATLGAGDPDLNPEGVEAVMQRDVPEIFERCGELIAERREHPTDDLTSVLVHAEVDGERLEEHEIVMGFFLLMAAGNDSTKATYCSAMRALMEHPEQRQMLLDDPSLVPSAVEEALRMFPAFAHFRRTATHDVELGGCPINEGDKVVMWYVSSNRDEDGLRRPGPLRRRRATRSTRRSAPAAGTSASARRSRGSSCRSCSRRRSRATRRWTIDGDPAVRGVAVRQPAQDAAGAAAPLSLAPQPEQLQVAEQRDDGGLQGDPDGAHGLRRPGVGEQCGDAAGRPAQVGDGDGRGGRPRDPGACGHGPDADREDREEGADRAQGGGGYAEQVAQRAGQHEVGDGVGARDDSVEAQDGAKHVDLLGHG